MSYRMFLNDKFSHLLTDLKVSPDGTLEREAIASYDVRFSNLCNLKCRMCDSVNSSAIAAEENSSEDKKQKIIQQPFVNFEDFSAFFLKNIKHIEFIYFCGGEPLLLDYHYKLLQLLIDHDRTDVVIKYNSNCTQLNFKDQSIISFWKKFKSVNLGMSLDDCGPRGEYIRDGSNWNRIKENLLLIRKECPHVGLEWTPTIQIMNVLTIPDIHMELIKDNLIDAYGPILLTSPDYFSVEALPKEFKIRVEMVIDAHVKVISRLGRRFEEIRHFSDLIKFMHGSNREDLLTKFREEILKKDKIRNQNFIEIFPELKFLMES
jgi:organic radical activating enzyme